MEKERLSARLARMEQACAGETITLRRLFPDLDPRDHALLALLAAAFSLPPIPMPGLSFVFASIAIIAGARMALGLRPWLPRWLMDRALPARATAKILNWASSALRRAQPLIRPRADWVAGRPWGLRAAGAVIALCGLMLMIPLPPPSNVPPAASLLLLCLGILESDGLVLALGCAAAALSAAFFLAIACLGWNGLKALAGL